MVYRGRGMVSKNTPKNGIFWHKNRGWCSIRESYFNKIDQNTKFQTRVLQQLQFWLPYHTSEATRKSWFFCDLCAIFAPSKPQIIKVCTSLQSKVFFLGVLYWILRHNLCWFCCYTQINSSSSVFLALCEFCQRINAFSPNLYCNTLWTFPPGSFKLDDGSASTWSQIP